MCAMFYANRCISLALLYGGTAPHIFSESVVAFLLDEPLSLSHIKDIPDCEIKQKLQRVSIIKLLEKSSFTV